MNERVPEGWSKENLGSIFDKISNGTTANQIETTDGESVTRIETISDGYVNFEKVGKIHSVDADKRYLMERGDILFSNINSVKHIGKVAYFNGEKPLYHGMNLLLFRTNETYAHSKFIFNLMRSDDFRLEISKRVKPAINQASISGGDLKEINFLSPPLPEQKKIASILTSVDEVIETTQRQIDKLQDLKKATMNELLTKGIGHTEFKDSELGRIPKSWEVVTLGALGDLAKGKGIAKKETTSEGVPCLRYAEIYTEYDFVIGNFKSFIRPEATSTAKKLKTGDIIFAGSGETVEDIGKSVAFVSDVDAFVGGDSIVFSPNIQCNSVFLSYQLNDDLRRIQLRKLGQGSSVIHVYSSGIMQLKVSLPPIQEQNEISETLLSYTRAIVAKKSKLSQTQSLKKSLMQDLLTGKVRVQVN